MTVGLQTKITYNNLTNTVTDWATFYGLNKHTLCSRIQNGWSLEKAFLTPARVIDLSTRRKKIPATDITIKPKVSVFTRIARFFYSLLTFKWLRFKSATKQITTPTPVTTVAMVKVRKKRTKYSHYLIYNGVRKKNSEWAKEFNINTPTLNHRIRSGWPVESALKVPVEPMRQTNAKWNSPVAKEDQKTLVVDGVEKTLVEWSESSGLSYSLIASRIRLGWEPKKIVTTPMTVRGRYTPLDKQPPQQLSLL